LSKLLKITVFTISGVVALFVAAVPLFLIMDANAYKSRLEAAASEVLGMEFRIGGRVRIGFVPGLVVTLKDVRIRNRGSDVVSAKEIRVGIDLLPLLEKEIHIGKIVLEHPEISIEKDRDGEFNFDKPEVVGGTLPSLDLAKVLLSDGSFRYMDKKSRQGFNARNCSLDIHHLQFPGGSRSDLMKNLSFTAELACGEIRKNDFTVSALKLSADGKNGIIDLMPVTMRIFGAQGSGSIKADFSRAVPHYRVSYSVPQLQIEDFFDALLRQKIAEGTINIVMNLSMHGTTQNEFMQTAHGQMLLRGKNLKLNGSDLDREVSRFESSQNFNLMDVGALFFAGPLGLVVTKGLNFASIYEGSTGSSKIQTFVADWKIERGVAQARDVAMATDKNRIALTGRLDFVNGRFDDVTVALIDAKGCATVRQKVRGTFQKPVMENPSVLRSLTGPALNLLKNGRDLFPGGVCKVFYAGSVAPPR